MTSVLRETHFLSKSTVYYGSTVSSAITLLVNPTNRLPVEATLSSASVTINNTSAERVPVEATLSSASVTINNTSAARVPVEATLSSASVTINNTSAARVPVEATLSSAFVTINNTSAARVPVEATLSSAFVTATLSSASVTINNTYAARVPVEATLSSAFVTATLSSASVTINNTSAARVPVEATLSSAYVTINNTSAARVPVEATLSSAYVTINNLSTGVLCDTRTLGNETDAFDRLRVSMPVTLYDYSSVLGKVPLRFDEVITGSATSTETTSSYIAMAVTVSGDSVVRQSRRYIPYQPGKSQLVLMTGVLALAGAVGVTSRIGYFDAVNGICFQMVDGAVSVVIYNAGVATTVPRASWNVDPFDGTGPSGYNIDFTKACIFVTDFAWLGIGRVRMGLHIAGRLYVCHEFIHAPTVSGDTAVTAPYIRYASLPMRQDISSNGGVDTMRMICGCVISESGTALFGMPFSIAPITSRTVSSSVFVPLFTIKLRADAGAQPWNRVNVRVEHINLINTTNTSFVVWALVKNVTFAGTTPTYVDTDSTNSAVQYCAHVAGTTASGGYTYETGYLESRSVNIHLVSTEMGSMVALSSDISGTSDTITVMVSLISGGNAILYGGLSWLESM